MSEEVNLGPSPEGIESYEVTAEWDEENQRVYVKDWNPYDGYFVSWMGLSQNQMENLVAWWQQRKNTDHE